MNAKTAVLILERPWGEYISHNKRASLLYSQIRPGEWLQVAGFRDQSEAL